MESPDECSCKRSETKPNFSLLSDRPFCGHVSQGTQLLFHTDVAPLRTLWVVFFKAQQVIGKEQSKIWPNHPWRLDDNRHNKTKVKWSWLVRNRSEAHNASQPEHRRKLCMRVWSCFRNIYNGYINIHSQTKLFHTGKWMLGLNIPEFRKQAMGLDQSGTGIIQNEAS